ncbi:hypothetical protein BDW42DRAFT_164891 [Aspergillus taichungensis]|uniref:Uncharacterized protein n=1 Tax=Aspergillus taichungensis TaxID=482145 RepID=A0A2J5I0V2_9EURO|nr:hypothetical protein BDW42DRAFT_164891 [Aspergillus taichungensis]
MVVPIPVTFHTSPYRHPLPVPVSLYRGFLPLSHKADCSILSILLLLIGLASDCAWGRVVALWIRSVAGSGSTLSGRERKGVRCLMMDRGGVGRTCIQIVNNCFSCSSM